MKIEDLIIFTDVIRYHSMNIAAEKHFMTPQNLSTIIRNMENELGVVLFKRSKKGSELVEEGEKFYLQVVKVLNEYEKALELIHRHEPCDTEKKEKVECVEMKILCCQGATNYAVLNAYKVLHKEENYNIVLDLETVGFFDYEKIVEQIEGKAYDIIACSVHEKNVNSFVNSCKGYITMHIFLDEFVLLVSKTHPLANRTMISISELRSQKFIVSRENICYKDVFGSEVPCQMVMDSIDSIIEQIEYSDELCTLVYKSMLGLKKIMKKKVDSFTIIPLDKKVYGTLIIMIREEISNEKAIRDFVKRIGQNFIESGTY